MWVFKKDQGITQNNTKENILQFITQYLSYQNNENIPHDTLSLLKIIFAIFNSFPSQKLHSFLTSDEFYIIQKRTTLLKSFTLDILHKENEKEVLEVIQKYIKMVSQKRNHFDEGWKAILPIILKDLIEYFAPDLFPCIHWDQKIEEAHEKLDTLYYLSHSQDRVADAIFKVILKQPVNTKTIYTTSFGKIVCIGNQAYIVLHIEVQTRNTQTFGQRMFQTQYRLIDRYNTPIYSIALTSFKTQKIEKFYYHVGKTKIGCEFTCANLLDFETPKDQKTLAKMKTQKKLLPFIIDVHLFAFRADKKRGEESFVQEAKQKINQVFYELKLYGLSQEEKRAFARYLARLLQPKTQDLKSSWEENMLGTHSHNKDTETLLLEKWEEFLEKQFDMVQNIAQEEKKAQEEKQRAQEQEIKARAEAAYKYSSLRGFHPQEHLTLKDFIELVLPLGSQKSSLIAEFAEEKAQNFKEVLEFIKIQENK